MALKWRPAIAIGDAVLDEQHRAIFDLASNALRPERWTSADAAGLPMFPALIRIGFASRFAR